MGLAVADWVIVAAYLALALWIGIRFRGTASKNLEGFFLGGRNLPWYIAGVSMVATTFAADTPLAVTELVGNKGIAGNWLWWNFLMGGMLTTFFFARLWRRSGVVTEVELIELRYGGKPAQFLRSFKAVYLGLIMNVLVMGWVNLAFITILQVFFGINDTLTLFAITGGIMLLTAIYSSLSGLLGVAMTDVIQFFIAIIGCIILAVIVVNSDAIGGIDGLIEKLPPQSLDFFPFVSGDSKVGSDSGVGSVVSTLTITVGSFLAYMGVMWWSSWYPGQEPGGGGYIAQRMMSAKNEKHSLMATLFFQVAHYCLRPWPWIIVGLCALVLYPDLSGDDKRFGFVYAMNDFLPTGLKGLLFVAFLAAYMSTISTQLNWGASYLVNDVYKRFLRPKSTDKQQVMASRVTSMLLMVVSLWATTYITSIKSVWEFVMEAGAGLGLVLILRWYWWRINAWSEIAATVTPFIVFGAIQFIKWDITTHSTSPLVSATLIEDMGLLFPKSFFITVAVTTIVWLLVTLVTKPESTQTLQNFYNRTQPGGWWKGFINTSETQYKKVNHAYLWLCWAMGVVFTYSILFLTGKIILHQWHEVAQYAISASVSFVVLWWGAKKGGVFS
jgi:solute:Na+ symporter, SSS family